MERRNSKSFGEFWVADREKIRLAFVRSSRRPRGSLQRIRITRGWFATHDRSCKIHVRITREICLKCPKILRARLPPRQHDHAPAHDGNHLRHLRRGRRRGPGLETIARADNSAFNGSAAAGFRCSSWLMWTAAALSPRVPPMFDLCCCKDFVGVVVVQGPSRPSQCLVFQSESSRIVPQMLKNRSRCAAFRSRKKLEKRDFSCRKISILCGR